MEANIVDAPSIDDKAAQVIGQLAIGSLLSFCGEPLE